MKRFVMFSMFAALTTALMPSISNAGPVEVSQVVFLQYQSANGPVLGGYYTGEYNFGVYAANQDGSGNLRSGDYLGSIAVWCLTPFATTIASKVAFAVGNGTDVGQLHDVLGVSDGEADSFYRDTTAMYLQYYGLGNTSLRDDLQAAIWERRDMIEGPAGTTDTDSFDLLANDYDLGSTIPASISLHTSFLGLNAGIIGNVYTPISSTPDSTYAGDIRYRSFSYSYDHARQEFGYQVPAPEPGSLLLLGSGLLAASLLLRRK